MSDVNIQNVLNERGNRYGKFEDNSELTFELFNAVKSKIETHPKPIQLALFMILHKVSRIANGDPTYLDNWVDIQGYTKLVVDDINTRQNPQELWLTQKGVRKFRLPTQNYQADVNQHRPQCVEAKSARTLLDSFVQHSNTLCQNGSEC